MADRKNIPAETKLRLFSEAAGHCQRPECLRPLFPAEIGGDKHIAEMAHVVPYGEMGPRHQERPEEEFEVNSFQNLILLCPACHTMIDKNPQGFSRGTLLGWKANHLSTLARHQGIRAYSTRQEVRAAVLAAMDENKAIWEEFAPSDGSSFEYDPESETARIWGQRMRGVILPNHFRIQAIMDANQEHMSSAERNTFARYKEHVRGLSERHICAIAGSSIRYPVEMDGVFA